MLAEAFCWLTLKVHTSRTLSNTPALNVADPMGPGEAQLNIGKPVMQLLVKIRRWDLSFKQRRKLVVKSLNIFLKDEK